LVYDDNSIVEYDGDYDLSRIKELKVELHLPLIVFLNIINIKGYWKRDKSLGGT
jgi:hypothetical protein